MRILFCKIIAIAYWALTFCANAEAISVGSKKFTESYVLSEIAKILLQKADFEVEHRQGIGGTIILWQALTRGDVALYPEYTGTIAEEILKSRRQFSLQELRSELAKYNVGITEELGFNNSYALVIKREKAEQLGIKTISDLRKHTTLRFGLTPEFLARQDGWGRLKERYGLDRQQINGLEHGLGYGALQAGQIDIKDSYTTDAKIAEYDLVTLKDDLDFFPHYRAVFLYRLDIPTKALQALTPLKSAFDEARMIALNKEAERTKSYALAARTFFAPGDTQPHPSRFWSLAADVPRLTVEHLTLVGISLTLAIVVSVPLGVVASRTGVISYIILSTVSIIQTIPSLALLALMIPLVGIGQYPAIIALFLYSLLPIVRNTDVGLQSVSPSMHQAGDALGLHPWTQLRWLYLPMASPAILAGIKTSAIIAVGNATLAGLIGGGGFGEPIQSGLQLNDNATILQGAIPAAALAILLQTIFGGIERIAVPRGLRLAGEAVEKNR